MGVLGDAMNLYEVDRKFGYSNTSARELSLGKARVITDENYN